MAKIRINYTKVISQARMIEDLSEGLEKQIKELEKECERIPMYWKSPAATIYRKKISELLNDLKTTKKNMASISKTIEKVAKDIKKEDDRQKELAKNLTAK